MSNGSSLSKLTGGDFKSAPGNDVRSRNTVTAPSQARISTNSYFLSMQAKVGWCSLDLLDLCEILQDAKHLTSACRLWRTRRSALLKRTGMFGAHHLQNQSPRLASPAISKLSPNNKPALSWQRDHSACRKADTPLRVRKTRENLKQYSISADIPPPCLHVCGYDEIPATPVSSSTTLHSNTEPQTPVPKSSSKRPANDLGYTAAPSDSVPLADIELNTKLHRQKSVSRRMLTRMKQGIGHRSRSSQAVRPTGSETSLVRRLSGRRGNVTEVWPRSHSLEIARLGSQSTVERTQDSSGQQPSSVQRSFTDSTVSTAEVLEEISVAITPDASRVNHSGLSPIRSSPLSIALSQPQATLRAPPSTIAPPLPQLKAVSLQVPYIDLCVGLSSNSIDSQKKEDIWVAIQATVKLASTTISMTDLELRSSNEQISCSTASEFQCGNISSLRLCFKATAGCTVREVIGQKSAKNLVHNQQCSLFIKVHVPRVRIRDSSLDLDQQSLFTELETIVGTLKMEVVHVEARYRHSLLPSDNVVAVRHTSKVKRPKAGSRWSLADPSPADAPASDVHTLLAEYIAGRYSITQALDMLHQFLGTLVQHRAGIRAVRDSLLQKLDSEKYGSDLTPSVIVTDSEMISTHSASAARDLSSAVLSIPAMDPRRDSPGPHPRSTPTSGERVMMSDQPCTILSKQQPSINTERSMSGGCDEQKQQDGFESQDSARRLWHHIRRSSLTAKQLQEMTSERLQPIVTNDGMLEELRHRALANKRSIGTETLKAFKWDTTSHSTHRLPEAPWM